MQKVLIAGCGEIALRAGRACRSLRLEVAAVYADADRSSMQVRCAIKDHKLAARRTAKNSGVALVPGNETAYRVDAASVAIPFHRRLLSAPAFRDGGAGRRWVERDMLS